MIARQESEGFRPGSKAEEKKEEDKPWWKQGLGAVIGNPVSQALLKPLEYLDYGRRAAILGLEEFAEGISGEQFSSQLNPDGSLKDTRSNMDKLKDPRYGFGELMGDTWDDSLPGGKSNVWANTLGFIGDVAFDPLTWTTGIGGAAMKGGTSLGKANRAGAASKMLAAGASEADVARFVRKGGGAGKGATTALESIGGQTPAVRITSSPFRGARGYGQRVPGLSKIPEVMSRGVGEVADRARQTGVGRKVSKIRDNSDLGEAYGKLFRDEGAMTFREAAAVAAADPVKRSTQKAFREVHDRGTRQLRRKLKNLSDVNRLALNESIQNGTPLPPGDFSRLKDEVVAAYGVLAEKATEKGVVVNIRKNYVPQIVTREGSKWHREGGAGQAAAREAGGMTADGGTEVGRGVYTISINSDSGVLMPRQFQAGQEIIVNGKLVKFGDKPPTIGEVNSKFREAGLDFDYFETNPAVIMEKYLDKLSSDVGIWAGGRDIALNPGLLSSGELGDGGRRALGLGDRLETIPEATIADGSRQMADGDIDVLRREAGIPLEEGQEEFLTSKGAVAETFDTRKDGSVKTTKVGSDRLRDGAEMGDLKLEEFATSKQDRTKQFNDERKDDLLLRQGRAEADKSSGLQASRVAAQRAGKQTAPEAKAAAVVVEKMLKVETQRANAATQAIRRIKGEIRSSNLDARNAQKHVDGLQKVVDDAEAAIRRLEDTLGAQTTKSQSTGIKLVRDRLVKARSEALESVSSVYDEAARKVDKARAALQQANALKARVNPPLEAAEVAAKKAYDDAAERLGLTKAQARLDEVTVDNKIQQGETGRWMDADIEDSLKVADNEVKTAQKLVDDLTEKVSSVPARLARKNADAKLATAKAQKATKAKVAKAQALVDDLSEQARKERASLGSARGRLTKANAGRRKAQAASRDGSLNASGDTQKGMRNATKNKSRFTQANLDSAKRKVDVLTAKVKDDPAVKAANAKLESAKRTRKNAPVSQGDAPNMRASSAGVKPTAREKGDLSFTETEMSELRQFIRDRVDQGAVKEIQNLENLARKEMGEVAAMKGRAAAPRLQAAEQAIEGANRAIEYYAKKIDANNAVQGSSLVRVQDAVTSNAGAQARKKEAAASLEELRSIVGRSTAKAPNTPRAALSDLDPYETELKTYLDDVLAAAEDAHRLGTTSVESLELSKEYANQAVRMMKNAKQSDITMRMFREMVKQKDFGRVVQAQLNEQLAIAWPGIGGNQYYLPKAILNSYNQVVKIASHNKFFEVVDSLTALFKTYATMTPGFHVRNAMSATFVNASEGVPMSTQIESAMLMREFRKSKDPVAWMAKQDESTQQAFEAAFGSGVGGQYSERGIGTRSSAFSRSTEWMFDNKATEWSQRVGGRVEGSVRLPVAMHTLRSGGDASEALARVTRLHFDYSQASDFDTAMKRVIPFWTFMSRNLPLQLTQMYTKPRAYAKYNSFIRNFSGEPEEGEPAYFQDVGAFRFMDVELGGLPLYLQPDLAHTRLGDDVSNIEAMTQGDFTKILSSANPMFTAPVEFQTKTNFFTGKKYDDTDVRELGTLEKPIELLARFLQQTETTPGGKTVVNESFIDALRSMIPLYDRGVRLAPGTVTGDKSKDSSDRQMESIARLFGVNIRQLSDAQRESTKKAEYYDGLREQRIQRALAKIDNQ